MVAEQHRIADGQARAQPAARVGQHDRPAAGRGRDPHAVHDRLDAAALVEVGAAEEREHPLAADLDRPDPPGVPLDGRRQEAGQVGDDDLGVRLAEHVDRRHPTRTEHDRDVVALDAGEPLEHLGRAPRLLLGLGELPVGSARSIGCWFGWFGGNGRDGHATR